MVAKSPESATTVCKEIVSYNSSVALGVATARIRTVPEALSWSRELGIVAGYMCMYGGIVRLNASVYVCT